MALILAAVMLSAVGHLSLKEGARHLGGLGALDVLRAAARSVPVLAGLSAWIAWALCWLYALRTAPLSRAYGLTSLTYVLVPLASALLFGEPVRRLQVAGMVLILAGIACMLSGE